MNGVARFIARRLAFGVVLVAGVSAIVFFLVNAIGNPIAMLIAGQPNATEEQINQLTAYYHLDEPAWERYLHWLLNLAHLDFGTSITYNEPVRDMLLVWGSETLKIQLPAILIAFFLAIAIATHASMRQYSRTDFSIMAGALLGQSLPAFLTGLILILVFAYTLGIFPSYGAYSTRNPLLGSPLLDALWHMVLPVSMLAYFNTATLTLLLRANLVEVLRHDYIMAARASGLPERRIVFGHALRNAIIPMLATAPVTETVFTWPGLGFLYINAIQQLDYPVIMGVSVVIAVMLVLTTLATDIAYVFIDPRIRLD